MKKTTHGAKGAGSIRKRPDGRWEARYTVGFDSDTGKPIRKSIYGKTQQEVRQRMAKAIAEIDDGTYYIAEYIGIIEKAGRTAEETEAVMAFAEWFGSADVQAAWGEEFDSYPCNEVAVAELYPNGIPAIYQLKNFALNKIEGTDMSYAEYVAAHSTEWTNIMTNLGFYWADESAAVAEPDWANLDWATLTQKAE